MGSARNWLILMIILVMLAVGATVVTVFWELNRGPDLYAPVYIQKQAETFLGQASTQLPVGETYGIVPQDESMTSGDWSVLSIARLDPSLGEDTGTEGLIAIGHLEKGAWLFRLPSDEGFDEWLDQVPDNLLDPDLKDYFRLDKGPAASSLAPQQLVSTGPLAAEELVFNLPWQAGVRYPVTAGPGQGEHHGNIQEAIDFGLPEGTPLLAVADGDVIEVKDDSHAGGCDKKFANAANIIRVQVAPDKTILYLHNQGGTAKVAKGQKIKAGQEIGRSGSTGFTCNWAGTGPGAHLHIILEKPCTGGGWGCGSSDLKFTEFKGVIPKKGDSFVSSNYSLADRQKLAEMIKEDVERLEQARENQARAQVLEALENFYRAYRCGNIKNCSEQDVTEELRWITERCRDKLFGLTFCLFCEDKDDNIVSVGPDEYISFPAPTDKMTKLTVRAKGHVKVTRGNETTDQYTVTNIYLVNEGGQWKVDDWDEPCGYIRYPDGKIEPRNSKGCELQPPPSLAAGRDNHGPPLYSSAKTQRRRCRFD